MASSKAEANCPNNFFNEMATLVTILGLCLWLYLASHTSRKAKGILYINGTNSIGRTDEDFICVTVDWWPPEKCDYGTCSWGNSSLLNLDLSNKILLNAVKAFSPLKIRLGGTLQDKVIYQTKDHKVLCTQFVKNPQEMFGFSQGCLSMSRWDELNSFFKLAEAKIVFGLNALNGRIIAGDGTAFGAWNSSNAEALIRYTVSKGYSVHGWELGNELSDPGIGASVAADQYAFDVISLQKLVQDIYKGSNTKPIVLGPGGFFGKEWFTKFITKSSNSLQAVTHHIYNLGPGVDDHLVEKILDPSYLDRGSSHFSNLEQILKNSGSSAVAWVGEAGGAYNSGRNLVSNRFVFSFWYLDQLGMASTYSTKTYCRQTLIGGNYGLLNTSTFVPNPDYYSALLWHRLMGKDVLSTSFPGTKKLRAYAHCSKHTPGITVLLINMDRSVTVQLEISVENTNAITNATSKMKQNMREEYHLTAQNGDIHSQTVLLNGNILSVNITGDIPALEPNKVNISEPIIVAPYSIVFAQIPAIQVPACS